MPRMTDAGLNKLALIRKALACTEEDAVLRLIAEIRALRRDVARLEAELRLYKPVESSEIGGATYTRGNDD